MPYIGVKPSYGRDYSSQKQVKDAWAAGESFTITDVGPHDGQQINKDCAPAGVHITVRYARQRKQVQVT
jgi:hypothetical protein